MTSEDLEEEFKYLCRNAAEKDGHYECPASFIVQIIQSRERKAFELSRHKLFFKPGTPFELTMERFPDFDDYKNSKEYLE